ncbi:MAG: nuclear transport factor 2 family protein [Microlunatus sp.]|nr:nuclear transport factor 2 family protein [Microlunatus sp.]
MQEIIERYIDTWNETDPRQRRLLLDSVWAEEANYIDPIAEAHGRDEIDTLIASAQAQFPGLRFKLSGPVDNHHRQARFTWGLGADGGEPAVVGFDVAVADESGRLVSVLGFLDKVPA